MKRYLLTEAAFIGAALLAAGSIITENDLPVGPHPDPDNDDDFRSPPPDSAIEIDSHGQPVKKRDRATMQALGLGVVTEVAPIAPHAPNPTMPQALPSHGVGETLPPGVYVPADGAQGSAGELDAEMVAATAGASPMAAAAPPAAATETAPKRRGS